MKEKKEIKTKFRERGILKFLPWEFVDYSLQTKNYFVTLRKLPKLFLHLFISKHYGKHFFSLTPCVVTLALGSRPKQKGLKGVGQEECENEDSHSQVSSPFGSWSFDGLPIFQRAIVEVKTPYIEEFFYIIGNPLNSIYLKWACINSFGHLKHKLWQKKRSGVKLTV